MRFIFGINLLSFYCLVSLILRTSFGVDSLWWGAIVATIFVTVFLHFLQRTSIHAALANNPLQDFNVTSALEENCALTANQSVDCRATILFTISLNSAKLWNREFNWPVFSVGMHKKSPNVYIKSVPVSRNEWGVSISLSFCFSFQPLFVLEHCS